MSRLTTVLKELGKVLESVELPFDSDLRQKRLAKVYDAPPVKRSIEGNTPCFIVWADASPENLQMGNTVEHNQTVQIDFYGPDTDQGLWYAREYLDAAMNVIANERRAGHRLNETVDYMSLPKTERPQEASMEWGGKLYPGFRMFVDLQWFEDVG